ncbi:DNA-binding LacI/PurR family transcriptional regulator [Crossiella equi]|uniref:DNA-binding LacI/PurR family transcriptional regulator n=1 Tax=Crossiella equi TaxID=130796 RepID=A0ABS5AI93_9PSEU|nr:LacI family DNA-binding transcriptional regulator [Crossiella equi]MBP2476280.1 DNA-binding LacI/PurR family transcriptional regulator [Crossiella equi]
MEQGAKRVTIRDIARVAGVSESAVSFALNNRPGVSAETRRRIMAVAEELDWRPNSAARALSAAKADTIGLVFARPAATLGVEPFFLQLVSGIQTALARSGTALLFQVVEDLSAECELYRRWWAERRVDGVLVVDPRLVDPRPALLGKLGVPALVVGGPCPGGTPSIWVDDAAAMGTIVDHLVRTGHRHIAHVAGLPRLIHTERRVRSFAQAMQRHGLPVEPSLPTDYSVEAGARATRRLLTAQRRPTAIVYDNDVMAVAGLSEATKLGVLVPNELSIVAWDDSTLCRLTHPQLTALVRDTAAFGARAARRLLGLVGGLPAQDVQDELPRLEPRGSTAPVGGDR